MTHTTSPAYSSDTGSKKSKKIMKKKKMSVSQLGADKTGIVQSGINYKNTIFLSRFITEQGKILNRRLTGLSAREQREITRCIKQARLMSLLSFVPNK